MEIKGVKVDSIVRLVREIVITVFVAVIAFKLVYANLSFDFSKLSATDLVALLLAIFSVGLSAAFYFAASGSSAKFYDNMHKFTKDTSVVLGQLTEKLQNLDKSQHEVKERFDKLYVSNNSEQNDLSREEREKETKVNEDREDLKNTIESLLEKYQIDAQEKIKFKEELFRKEKQLSASLSELSELKSEQRRNAYDKVKKHVSYMVRKALREGLQDFDILVERVLSPSGSSAFKRDLYLAGLIESTDATNINHLTDQGIALITDYYERYGDN